MKLSKIGLLAVKGLSKDSKERIATAIGISMDTLWRCLRENADNGDLTLVKAVQVISAETGLDQSQILEDEDTIKEDTEKEGEIKETA